MYNCIRIFICTYISVCENVSETHKTLTTRQTQKIRVVTAGFAPLHDHLVPKLQSGGRQWLIGLLAERVFLSGCANRLSIWWMETSLLLIGTGSLDQFFPQRSFSNLQSSWEARRAWQTFCTWIATSQSPRCRRHCKSWWQSAIHFYRQAIGILHPAVWCLRYWTLRLSKPTYPSLKSARRITWTGRGTALDR